MASKLVVTIEKETGQKTETTTVSGWKCSLCTVPYNTQFYTPPVSPIRKLPEASWGATFTRGQTEEATRTTVLQPTEQKPQSQKLIKMKRQRIMFQMKEQDKVQKEK